MTAVKLGQRLSHAFFFPFHVQLSGVEKPPAGEPENSGSSSAAAAGAEAADGGSKVTTPRSHSGFPTSKSQKY